MTAQPFATADDLAARWRPLSSAESTVATALLADASALLRSRFPGIDAQVASGGLDATILTMVACGIVRRAMVAPAEGVTSESETTGPFSHSQTYANPMGNVFLTAADMTLILGYKPRAMSGTFANDTTQIAGAVQRVFGW